MIVKILNSDLDLIRSHAKTAFDSRPKFENMSLSDMQLWCILQGFDQLIVSRGGIPGFTVVPYTADDSDSIHEDGQG